jgi:hypothetical protein
VPQGLRPPGALFCANGRQAVGKPGAWFQHNFQSKTHVKNSRKRINDNGCRKIEPMQNQVKLHRFFCVVFDKICRALLDLLKLVTARW